MGRLKRASEGETELSHDLHIFGAEFRSSFGYLFSIVDAKVRLMVGDMLR
jgi:hypothetical protein